MLFNVVEILIVTLMCCVGSVHYVHVLQMGRYQLPAYRHWISRNRDRLLKEKRCSGNIRVAPRFSRFTSRAK